MKLASSLGRQRELDDRAGQSRGGRRGGAGRCGRLRRSGRRGPDRPNDVIGQRRRPVDALGHGSDAASRDDLDEPRPLEDTDVVGNRARRTIESAGDLAAAGWPLREHRQDSEAERMPERGEALCRTIDVDARSFHKS